MSVERLMPALPALLAVFLYACDPASPHKNPALSETNPDDQLASLVEAYAANGDFSGVVAVARDGIVLGSAATGARAPDDPAPPDLDTSFHIASISKTFTSAGIRLLVADGTLTLDDLVADHLPGLPIDERITVRHLLDHESGIPDYWTLADIDGIAARASSSEELVRWLVAQPLDFEPGSNSAYSNSGYALLAAVIEAAARQPYHAFLEERVYPVASLESTAAYRGDASAAGQVPDFAPRMSRPSLRYDPLFLIGAGSLKSTARDLLRWCDAFLADYLDPATPAFLHGWGVREENGRRRAQQTGRNPGFSAHLRAYPDDRTCVVVLSNLESDAVSAMGESAAAVAFDESFELPAARRVVDMSADELRPLVGRYEIAPGRSLEIVQRPEGLLLRGSNGPFLPLEPLGDDRFFYRQLHTSLTAERGDGGRVEALLWGGSWRLARLD